MKDERMDVVGLRRRSASVALVSLSRRMRSISLLLLLITMTPFISALDAGKTLGHFSSFSFAKLPGRAKGVGPRAVPDLEPRWTAEMRIITKRPLYSNKKQLGRFIRRRVTSVCPAPINKRRPLSSSASRRSEEMAHLLSSPLTLFIYGRSFQLTFSAVAVRQRRSLTRPFHFFSFSFFAGRCVGALGMESGAIRDEDISASSSFDGASVGPHNAR